VRPSLRRPIRRIESGFLRTLAYIGGFLLATLVVSIVIGVANSNIFWGEANQIARIPIPGRQKVELPAGETQATVAVALPGRGNETPELLIPPLELSVTPYGEAGKAEIREELGGSVNANDKYDDTQRAVWKIEAPSAGTYLVSIKGDMTGYGVNAQLWLGHEPAWVHGWKIWLYAAIIVLLGAAIFAGVQSLRRRRRGGPGGPGNGSGNLEISGGTPPPGYDPSDGSRADPEGDRLRADALRLTERDRG
jgi:hypothetical protein